MVMLSDILPTGFECGVLNGQVKPGDTIAIVGAGPVGLAVLMTAQFYSPAAIFMIDLDDKRLAVAKQFGATTLINSGDGHAADHVMELTEGAGVDVAIEAVGIPATFDICQAMVAPGGRIANVGVHGKPVELHLERLWDRNISLTTRLVDTVTTAMLLKIVRSGKLQPGRLVTHRFAINDIMGLRGHQRRRGGQRARGIHAPAVRRRGTSTPTRKCCGPIHRTRSRTSSTFSPKAKRRYARRRNRCTSPRRRFSRRRPRKRARPIWRSRRWGVAVGEEVSAFSVPSAQCPVLGSQFSVSAKLAGTAGDSYRKAGGIRSACSRQVHISFPNQADREASPTFGLPDRVGAAAASN